MCVCVCVCVVCVCVCSCVYWNFLHLGMVESPDTHEQVVVCQSESVL